MNERPLSEERYTKGADVINYVVYKSTAGAGNDEVLQHKLFGTTETAHITLHPDGAVNFRVKRTRTHLEAAIKSDLGGFTPAPSPAVKKFISKIRRKI